jgi:hypothetical protein
LFLLTNQPVICALLVRIGAPLQMNNGGKIMIVLFLFSNPRKKTMNGPWIS